MMKCITKLDDESNALAPLQEKLQVFKANWIELISIALY